MGIPPMYRKEIKVLDCTIRDGGLINNYQFGSDFVKTVYRAACDSGVDYVELGKKLAESDDYTRDKWGPWNFCDDDDLRSVIDSYPTRRIRPACGGDVRRRAGRRRRPAAADASPVDMIRTACYVADIDKGLDLVKRTKDLGYETTLNIMAPSVAIETDLVEGLEAGERGAGGRLPLPRRQLRSILLRAGDRLRRDVRASTRPRRELGFHAHNNQQLAFSNTQQAIIDGVNLLDATINGIGRGAGNCNLELLLNFLKNPKFDVRPVYKAIQEVFIPLREEIEWGFNDIYGISGTLNQHPRDAMKQRTNAKIRDDCYDFYVESRRIDDAGVS